MKLHHPRKTRSQLLDFKKINSSIHCKSASNSCRHMRFTCQSFTVFLRASKTIASAIRLQTPIRARLGSAASCHYLRPVFCGWLLGTPTRLREAEHTNTISSASHAFENTMCCRCGAAGGSATLKPAQLGSHAEQFTTNRSAASTHATCCIVQPSYTSLWTPVLWRGASAESPNATAAPHIT